MQRLWIRRAIDILMMAALFFLMGYPLWDDAAHEWVGVAMGLLFILHQWYNRRWYRSLRHGPWSLVRGLHVLVDLLAVLAMLALMVSGVVLSSHVFDLDAAAADIGTAQVVHLAASHWLYVLLALHLGLHGRALLARRDHAPHGVVAKFLSAVWMAFAFYGLMAFVARDFLDAMFLQVHFLWIDASEPVWRFYVDALAIMACFALIASSLVRWTRRMRRG